jgi:aspartate/methionine/tyrosine aminotransferase
MTVRYLNIGDPVAFGFKTPSHIVEAAVTAMRDGHNGYLASAGILRRGKQSLPTMRSAASTCRRTAS